jgi:hypothetical protein
MTKIYLLAMLYLLMKQKDMIHRLKITMPMLPLVYHL